MYDNLKEEILILYENSTSDGLFMIINVVNNENRKENKCWEQWKQKIVKLPMEISGFYIYSGFISNRVWVNVKEVLLKNRILLLIIIIILLHLVIIIIIIITITSS